VPSYLRTEVVSPKEARRLKAYPGNPRTHDDKLLDSSIAEHGQFRSVLARELPDGSLQILAGHGTRDALVRAKRDVQVEVWDVPDDNQARQIVLMDNRASDLAQYNNADLIALLDQGLDGTGWDTAAYEKLLDDGVRNPLPEEGDADVGDDDRKGFRVLIECDTEEQQVQLMQRLLDEGFECRALL
jgi:ParB-like chromosome segregation protein Spo0J